MKNLNILIVIFLISYLTETNAIENIKITQNPGIYFEYLSSLKIISSHWNVVTYYNLTNFEEKFESTNCFVDSVFNISDNLTYKSKEINSTCSEFKTINTQILNKIKKR